MLLVFLLFVQLVCQLCENCWNEISRLQLFCVQVWVMELSIERKNGLMCELLVVGFLKISSVSVLECWVCRFEVFLLILQLSCLIVVLMCCCVFLFISGLLCSVCDIVVCEMLARQVIFSEVIFFLVVMMWCDCFWMMVVCGVRFGCWNFSGFVW